MKLLSKIICIALVGSLMAVSLTAITVIFGGIQKHYCEPATIGRQIQVGQLIDSSRFLMFRLDNVSKGISKC